MWAWAQVQALGVSGLGVPTPWHLGVGFKEAAFWSQAEGTNLESFLPTHPETECARVYQHEGCHPSGICCLLWTGAVGPREGDIDFPNPCPAWCFHFAWILASTVADLNMGPDTAHQNLCTQE